MALFCRGGNQSRSRIWALIKLNPQPLDLSPVKPIVMSANQCKACPRRSYCNKVMSMISQISSFHHYIVSYRALGKLPVAMLRGTYFGLEIGYFPGSTVTELVSGSGVVNGVCLGTVLDLKNNIFRPNRIIIPHAFEDKLEQFVYTLGGSWIAILKTASGVQFFVDACGSKPLVYSTDKGIVASSAAMILDDSEYESELSKEASSPGWFERDLYFPAGITAHSSIRRLLPNHSLNLSTWKIKRIWPLEQLPAMSADQALANIVSVTHAGLKISNTQANCLVPLTAGNETRGLLAMLRDNTDSTHFFTATMPGSFVDQGCASRLARTFNLKHQNFSVRRRSNLEQMIWQRNAGNCVGGVNMYNRLFENFNPSVEISGLGGEIGRGFLWLSTDKPDGKVGAPDLLKRLKLPDNKQFEIELEKWIEEFPQFDLFTLLDCAYIEHRMATWAFPQTVARDIVGPQIYPLIHRESFSAMMSAPAEFRRSGQLFKAIVEKEWPQLLTFPINQGTRWEKLRTVAHKLSKPGAVGMTFRKLGIAGIVKRFSRI